MTEWREELSAVGNEAYAPLVEALLDGGWETSGDGFWFRARPVGNRLPHQGWKLHVSAEPGAAPAVLAACVPVLREHRVAFKCAEDLAVLLQLLSTRYAASGTGKFLTVYPADPEQCAAVAESLADATAGLAGPPVLSDALWRDGSPVYHRYGAFTTADRLTEDGTLVPVLLRPDGTAEPDVRDRFAPPGWAPALPRRADTAAARHAPLVADRYRVRAVLRRSARGGVFLGTDTRTGREVVIKHVRAHIGATPEGTDARDVLRHEARVLDALAGTGVVPAVLALVETGTAAFLVQERLAGVTLAEFVDTTWRPGESVGARIWQLAGSLADAVAAVHAAGWVLGDLSPGNVIVGPDGRCRLIDLELAARPGDRVLRDHTAGYAAPEQYLAPLRGATPGQAADAHALGGLWFLLAAGRDPLAPHGSRSTADLLGAELAVLDDRHGFAGTVALLVRGLLSEDPARRPTARTAAAGLAAAVREHHPDGGARTPDDGARTTAPERVTGAAVLADGIDELTRLVLWFGEKRLKLQPAWRRRRDGLGTDFGAGGPLLVLARAARAQYGTDQRELRDAVRLLAGEVERAPSPESLRPGPRPGLASGEAGRLWALWEAAEALGDEALKAGTVRRAAVLAAAAQPLVNGADSTLRLSLGHGIAGLGMLQLRLYLATREPGPAEAASACAQALVAALDASPVPPTGGLAAGAAGIAWFLLAAGRFLDHGPAARRAEREVARICDRVAAQPVSAVRQLAHHDGLTGEGRLLVAAVRCGLDTLAAVQRLVGAVPHWCSPARTGLARGLSGWAEFLLDAAELDGTGRTVPAALDPVFDSIAARANPRHGRLLLPDDSGRHVNHSLADGTAGPLWVGLRLRTGGPGLWDPRPVPVRPEGSSSGRGRR
ncbi:protein kinase [Kitasatospora saccharophila]|uniref:class III lanthionine synthetase LanKC N-terminal domain-containing protein n=1 Tax=Kitasatospora saccharophila TaxID=407973 RepID=UPI003631F1C9